MPRVKIDYVVSFSSEDPEHPANNLLEWEISKKKWLCSKGESSCSVVLQLTRAVKIESINIGAYHAASVEVLVGLSEKPNDPFEVLVPTCMLLSPSESRREAVERVRSFSGAALAAARARRWDRVRLVCAQPYNKHCKYGLSFVHLHSAEAPAPAAPAPAPAATAPAPALEADEEEFQPGELFARHWRASTGAQIRQASMDAIKNNSDKSTKLLKTPITKPSGGDRRPRDDKRSNRHRDNLVYTDDDDRPHAKVDHVVERHKRQKEREQTPNKNNKERHELSNSTIIDKTVDTSANRNGERETEDQPTSQINAGDETSRSGHKKRKRSDESGVLEGVRFTLSGYENPLRGELRAAALAMGATYLPDYTPDCTHIICAFPDTPKLRAARAAGGRAVAVGGAWLRACRRRRARVPWRWFAAQPRERRAPPADRSDDTEEDTDDEIEKFIQRQENKKRVKTPARDEPEPRAGDANSSRESDVAFVRDERVRGHVTLDDSDATDCDDRAAAVEEIDESKVLPSFFEGLTFSIDVELARGRRALLARYIRAYGGLLLEASDALGECEVDYHVCGGDEEVVGMKKGGKRVSPQWVWRCHQLKAVAPTG